MTYFIEQHHNDAECLRALDELAEKSPRLLDSCYLTCMSGEHAGYAFVEAGSESEAREMVPPSLREKSRVVKADKFTPDQIRSFHES